MANEAVANKKTVLIAGGGTGGHIYPALTIAKALIKKHPDYQVEFVGTELGLESKLIPRENFKLHYVSVGKLNKNVGLLERLLTILQLPLSLLTAFILLQRVRPVAVLGVGGYASAPVVLVAALCGYPAYIWEPNAFPGLANRWLSRFVRKCMVVFSAAGAYLKNKSVVQVSMPVRGEIEAGVKRVPQNEQFRVLIFGGSQGARAINNCVLECVKDANWRKRIHIVHQTGSLDFAKLNAAYAGFSGIGQNLEVLEYLHDMPNRYAWADLVICRAGTGTLSELAACGKASILIPLPSAADDHQRKNAEEFVQMGAARLLPQDQLTPERLIKEIVELMQHPEQISKMESNVKKFHQKGAAERIVDIILEQK